MIKVLMIDEEFPDDMELEITPTPYMRYYAQELIDDHEIDVTICRTFENANKLIQSKAFDVVSIDVCMPVLDEEADREAKHGSRTGLILYRSIVQTQGWNPAIILLSNIPSGVLEKNIAEGYPYYENLLILLKLDTPPFQFVEKIKEMFQKGSQS